MEQHSNDSLSGDAEGTLAAEFARLLAANFAREVGGKESDAEEEKSSEGSHDPPEPGAAKEKEKASTEEPHTGEGSMSPERSLTAPANNRKGPRLASSRFRGCTRHRRTKRYEAHIWDQRQQRYLGGFDREVDAGKAHDVMALKCRVPTESPQLNFPMDNYAELIPLIDRLPKEEVVAQLRQLNRTAPRPKARKPPTKTKSSSSLAGLTTRSGGITKQGKAQLNGDGQALLADEPMASYLRTGRLGAMKLQADQSIRFIKTEGGPGATTAKCTNNTIQSAFASQKDVALPGWDPFLSLDCPLSPDFTDVLSQLGDPSDLLNDSHAGLLGAPDLSGGGVQALYRSPYSSYGPFTSSGALYMGKAINACRQPSSLWLPRDQRLSRDTASLPEPLHVNLERPGSLPSTGEAVKKASIVGSPGLQLHKYQSALSDGTYSHSGGSQRQSYESEGSHFGSLPDKHTKAARQLPLQRQQASTWEDLYACGKEGVRASQQPFRKPPLEAFRWDQDLAFRRPGSQQMAQPYSGSSGWSTQPSSAWPHSPQQPGPLRAFEHQSSFGSVNQPASSWDKGFTDGQGMMPVQNDGHSRQPGCDQPGMSFTQMLTQDMAASDQLDCTVLDAVGTWSPDLPN